MDDALGMHQHLYPRRIDIKEPAGLDHLQPLIDQGRGIDRDLPPHGPGRVLQGILRPHILKLLLRPAPERPAGSGKPDLVNAVSGFTVQGLEDGAVLAVHRKDGNTLLSRKLHDQVPCRDQRLLIGQSNLLSRFDRGHSRPDAHHPHDRGHEILVTLHRSHLENSVHPGQDLHIQISHTHAQILRSLLIPHDCLLRSKLPDLLLHQSNTPPGTERHDLNISLLPRHIQCLLSDRSGRTQYRNFFQSASSLC